MNILIVHSHKGFYGGAEEVVYQLVTYLSGKHAVTLLAESNPVRLWRDVQKYKSWADVINCHNFPSTLAAFPTRKPIVWYCNEPPEYFTNWWRKPIEAFNRWWVKKSKMAVVVADQFNSQRFERLYGIEPNIVPYGTNYAYWSHNPGIERSKHPIILQVGHREFFPIGESIFWRVHKKYPNVELVQLWGLPHDKVREAYHQATVLIHPIKSQGGWLVPFEAMSAGLPVVTTLNFSASGLVAKLGGQVVIYEVEAMASAVCKLLEIPPSGARSREWIRDNLTWEKFGNRMEKIFKEVV